MAWHFYIFWYYQYCNNSFEAMPVQEKLKRGCVAASANDLPRLSQQKKCLSKPWQDENHKFRFRVGVPVRKLATEKWTSTRVHVYMSVHVYVLEYTSTFAWTMHSTGIASLVAKYHWKRKKYFSSTSSHDHHAVCGDLAVSNSMAQLSFTLPNLPDFID